MKKYSCGVRSHGFTLIELLVVIAIIVLLVSILVPSLNQARKLARKMVCSTNLHNVSTAWAMYTTESNGGFPYGEDVNGDGKIDGGDLTYANLYLEYMLDPYTSSDASEIDGSSNIWICPESPLRHRSAAAGYERSDGVSHNWTINSYMGLRYHNLEALNEFTGQANASNCTAPWQITYFSKPSGVPIQHCSMRYTKENAFRGWHYPDGRPAVMLDGHVVLLETEDYQGDTDAVLNPRHAATAWRNVNSTCADFAIGEN